jgi:hypothetical protein
MVKYDFRKKLENKTLKSQYNKKKKEEYLSGNKEELPNNFKIVFSNKEAREIIENLVRFKKSDKRIYTLLGLWVSEFLCRPTFRQLKISLGKYTQINLTDFESNNDNIKSIIHFLISDLIEEKQITPNRKIRDELGLEENEKIYRSHNLSLDWDNKTDGEIIKYTYTRCYWTMFNAGELFFRNSETSRTLSSEQKKKVYLKIKEIADLHSDLTLSRENTIKACYNAGITDDDMYRYRYMKGYGERDAFVQLDPTSDKFINFRSESTSKKVASNIKQKIYEEIFLILNSNVLSRFERDILKMEFNLPSASTSNEELEYNLTPKQFFDLYKEYNRVLKKPIQKITQSGKENTYYLYDSEYLRKTKLFKNALEKFKSIILDRFGSNDARDYLSDFLLDSTEDLNEI